MIFSSPSKINLISVFFPLIIVSNLELVMTVSDNHYVIVLPVTIVRYFSIY